MGRLPSRDVFGIVLIAILATAFVMAGLSSRVDDPMKFWFGTFGMLPLTAALVTAAMLFVNSSHNARMLALARQTERSTRFQKAAELAGGDGIAKQVAGCSLLADLALEDPEHYQQPAVQTLKALIADRGVEVSDAIFKLTPSSKRGSLPTMKRSGMVTTAALGGIARVDRRTRWISTADDNNRLRVWGLYLRRSLLRDADLSKMSFPRFVFAGVYFQACQMHDTVLEGRCFATTFFQACDLQNLTITATNLYGEQLKEGAFNFKGSKLRNVSINGIAIPDQDA